MVRSGGGSAPLRIRRLEGPRDLELAGAAAGIVVRARRGMIEVAGEDDLMRRDRGRG